MSTITIIIAWSDLTLNASNGSIVTISVQLELITLMVCKLHNYCITAPVDMHCLLNIINQEIHDIYKFFSLHHVPVYSQNLI